MFSFETQFNNANPDFARNSSNDQQKRRLCQISISFAFQEKYDLRPDAKQSTMFEYNLPKEMESEGAQQDVNREEEELDVGLMRQSSRHSWVSAPIRPPRNIVQRLMASPHQVNSHIVDIQQSKQKFSFQNFYSIHYQCFAVSDKGRHNQILSMDDFDDSTVFFLQLSKQDECQY